MSDDRAGRGRLSSLDLVPDNAQDDIIWAMGELNKRQRTQADILFDLNDRLAVKGVEAISKSAFNRKAVRVSMVARRIDEARALFTGIAPQFTPEKIDETNVVIGELIKILIVDLLDAGADGISTKGAMELSRAYVASIQGQAISADRRRRLEQEFERKAAEAITKVGKARGLSSATVEDIRSSILGLRKE